MSSRKKEVEYKDSFDFDLFPDFEYDVVQRHRFLTFHGFAKNLVKLVNYASNFDQPYRICLIYLVGEPKPDRIENALNAAGCSDRVCVLTSKFPEECHEIYSRFEAVRKSLRCMGYWDEDQQKPNDSWYKSAQKNSENYQNYPDLCQTFVDQDCVVFDTMRDYTTLQKNCSIWFSAFRCYRLGHSPITLLHRAETTTDCGEICSISVRDPMDQTILDYRKSGLTEREIANRVGISNVAVHKRLVKLRSALSARCTMTLNELATLIYPSGAEALSLNRFAAVSPAGVACGLRIENGELPDKRLGFLLDEKSKTVQQIASFIKHKVEADGFCSLSDLRVMMQSPPLGFWYSGYAAACFALAIRKFSNRSLFYHDGITSFRASENLAGIFHMLLNPVLRRQRRYEQYLYMESRPHKIVKRFVSSLFGVPIRTPGENMRMDISRAMRATHRLPLCAVDERLLDYSLWNLKWFDKKEVSLLAVEAEQNGEEIREAYARYLSSDSCVSDEVRKNLPEYAFIWSRQMWDSSCNKKG